MEKIIPKRGEIWHIDLGKPFGSEQGGKRPALIIQNNIGNEYSPTTIVCPITTKNKNYGATHVTINCLNEESHIMCEQIRVVDKTRLERKMGCITNDELNEIVKKLKLQIMLNIEMGD